MKLLGGGFTVYAAEELVKYSSMWVKVFEHGLVLGRVLADVACDGGAKFRELPINPIGQGHPGASPTWLAMDVLEKGGTGFSETAHSLGSISFPVFCQNVIGVAYVLERRWAGRSWERGREFRD